METTYVVKDDVLNIKFIGQIAGTEAGHFTEECNKIINMNHAKNSIDLTFVPSMNSAAIGQLIKLHKNLLRDRRMLIISGIHDNLYQAFYSIHLDKILKIKK